MGSIPEELPSQDQEELTVLVTGFGPFRTQNPVNPAWEIAHALPPLLPPSPKDSENILPTPRVRILVHPSPVKVAYESVIELVPKLWENPKIDLAIHIGMASGRRYYSIERRAHRDGYSMPDVDRELLSEEARRKMLYNFPPEIVSDVDVDDVWRRWRMGCVGEDVRVSEDAGRYLCDFIYFGSLSELVKRGEEKRVVFLHVPVEADSESVQRGVEVTVELIRAMVRSRGLKKAEAMGMLREEGLPL